MTEREEQLVRDYGPRFCVRAMHIFDEMYYLPEDAISILTDEEWKECAKILRQFDEKLMDVRRLVVKKIDEVEPIVEKQIKMFDKAEKELKKFGHM